MIFRCTSLLIFLFGWLLTFGSPHYLFAQDNDVVALEDQDNQEQQDEASGSDEDTTEDETPSQEETSEEQPQEGEQSDAPSEDEQVEEDVDQGVEDDTAQDEAPSEDQEETDGSLAEQEKEADDESPIDEKGEEEAVEEEVPAPEEDIPIFEEEVVEEEAIEPEIIPEEEEAEDVLSIDTLSSSEPSGNWFFKRHWYQKAQAKYGELGGTISKIFQQRTAFLQLNKTVQSEVLDPFYTAVGIDMGEISQAVKMLLVQVEDLRMYEGGLDEEQEDLLEALTDAQEQLEQLLEDVQGISQLDKAFERSFDIMSQQIDIARSYQEQAFSAVEAISRELNDLQAKAEYLKVRSFARSVQDIQRYVGGDLLGYTNRLAQHIQMQTEQVKAELEVLRQMDIDIIEEARKLRADFCPPPAEPSAQEGGVEEAEVSSGFLSTAVSATTNAILWPFRALGSLFGETSTTGETVAGDEEEAEIVTEEQVVQMQEGQEE